MKNKTLWWCFIEFVFVSTLGTLLHFLFELTNLLIFAPISAVNESTWEHMKILFMPCFIFAIIESLTLYKKVKGFFNVKFIATLVATLTIPLLFYTYNGAIGKSPFYVDILIFYIASFVNSLISYKLLKTPKTNPKSGVCGLIGLLLLFLAFAISTFYPSSLPIFIDPLNS